MASEMSTELRASPSQAKLASFWFISLPAGIYLAPFVMSSHFLVCLNLDLILMYLYLQINAILPLWPRVEFFVE